MLPPPPGKLTVIMHIVTDSDGVALPGVAQWTIWLVVCAVKALDSNSTLDRWLLILNLDTSLRIRLLTQEMQETWVRSLGQKDPPGEEMATYSSILAWRIPRTEEPGRLQSMGSQSLTRLLKRLNTHARISELVKTSSSQLG